MKNSKLKKIGCIAMVVILILFWLTALRNFNRNLRAIYFSVKGLVATVDNPDLRFARVNTPYFEPLLYITQQIPNKSKVCFPEKFYNDVFMREDGWYKYLWMGRQAFIQGDNRCEYNIIIDGDLEFTPQAKINIKKT